MEPDEALHGLQAEVEGRCVPRVKARRRRRGPAERLGKTARQLGQRAVVRPPQQARQKSRPQPPIDSLQRNTVVAALLVLQLGQVG